MKKLFTLLFFAFVGNLYAQDISLGVKGGINMASLSNITVQSYNVVGYGGSSSGKRVLFLPHFGAYSEIKINDMFSVQPELLFTMKGFGTKSEWHTATTVHEEHNRYAFSYIDIPVQMRANFGNGFYALAGPYIGFLAGANSKNKTEETINGNTNTSKSSSNSKTGLNTVDGGIYLGVGYEVESGLGFGLRWCRGFSDVTDNRYNNNTTNSNSVFQFSVTYKLTTF